MKKGTKEEFLQFAKQDHSRTVNIEQSDAEYYGISNKTGWRLAGHDPVLDKIWNESVSLRKQSHEKKVEFYRELKRRSEKV